MNSSFGLVPKELQEIERILLAGLAEKQTWRVDVFGSRARGAQKKYSDIDLWIESQPELNNREIQNLMEAFVDSDIPIKVDIVSPGSVLAEYKDNIFQEKVKWLSSEEALN